MNVAKSELDTVTCILTLQSTSRGVYTRTLLRTDNQLYTNFCLPCKQRWTQSNKHDQMLRLPQTLQWLKQLHTYTFRLPRWVVQGSVLHRSCAA